MASSKRPIVLDLENEENGYPPPSSKRSNRRANTKVADSRQQGKLDSNLFQSYFENIWKSFPEEKRASFAYLDSMWFSMHTKASYKTKVLTWIKKKQIFSKKYVLVPIVHCLPSETSKPCMLLLDSLQEAGLKRFEPAVRKFVLDIYKAEERPENKNQIYQIPFLVPKVPQQRNGEECGNFVLYFISLFMGSAPENFSIDEGYPYFMKEDWFALKDYKHFCKELNSCSQ